MEGSKGKSVTFVSLRRLSQTLFLLVFFFLFIKTDYTGSDEIEYAVNISDDRQIRRSHLPSYLMEAGALSQPIEQAPPSLQAVPSISGSGFEQTQPPRSWPEAEKHMIMAALVREGGRKNKAALSLGWARSTLWRKMKQYGID